jgi:hypothetical protein
MGRDRRTALAVRGTVTNTGSAASVQRRRACPITPVTRNAAPATSQGRGLRCSSQPLAVAVCQQVVPGPSRCTHATKSRSAPTPATTPNAELRIDGRDPRKIATAATGTSKSGPSETALSAAAAPSNSHTQNQAHPTARSPFGVRNECVPEPPSAWTESTPAKLGGHSRTLAQAGLAAPECGRLGSLLWMRRSFST